MERNLGRAAVVAAAVAVLGLLLHLGRWLLVVTNTAWLVVAALLLGLAWYVVRRRLPGRVVLELDLQQAPVEAPADALLARAAGQHPPVLRDVLELLSRAGADDRVVAVLLRVELRGVGLARAQELREAIHALRETGTRTVAWASSFGEPTDATLALAVAAACDEVVLQPLAGVGPLGVRSRRPYARGLLDRWGLLPRFDHRREFKSAAELLTEHAPTPPAREAARSVLGSAGTQLAAAIAADRGLETARVRELFDQAPLTGDQALAGRLVDRIDHLDRVRSGLAEITGGTCVDAERFRRRRPRRPRAPRVALVTVDGMIAPGRSRPDPLLRGRTAGAEDVVEALDAAVERGARAIVLRIDSPGGSAVASERMWRAIVHVRERGLPVVVSMGDRAASGGYYLAVAADRIVAHPGTLTGSIGVVAGKVVTGEAWRRLGVEWHHDQVGAHATMWAPERDFSDEEWSRFQRDLDEVYELFVRRVADGRGRTVEDIEEVARGRVWTGADAHARGLVDDLGGTETALRHARELAGLAPDTAVRLEPITVGSRLPWRRLQRTRRAWLATLDDLDARVEPLREVADGTLQATSGRDAALWWDGYLR